jgi:GNAT superfamily N-acetyltransferase
MSCKTTTTFESGHAHDHWDVVAPPADEAAPTVGEHRGMAERRAARHAATIGTVIDTLRPREAWPLVAVHEGMSPTSRRLRYSAPTPRLNPRMVRVLTDLRPGHHEAYAAWHEGRPIGIVRWIRTPELPGAAELAIEVVDAEQGRGVGRALTAFAAVRAWRAGVRTMIISVDPGNVRVHGWLAQRRARAFPDDAGRFSLPIQALFAASPAAHRTTTSDRRAGRPDRSKSPAVTGLWG